MDKIATKMRNIVLDRREMLNSLSQKDEVYVLYNGVYWKCSIVTIRPHAIAFPEFRVRCHDGGKLDWVSGAQVFSESDIPEECRY